MKELNKASKGKESPEVILFLMTTFCEFYVNPYKNCLIFPPLFSLCIPLLFRLCIFVFLIVTKTLRIYHFFSKTLRIYYFLSINTMKCKKTI